MAAGLTSCSGFLTEDPKFSQSNELTLSTFDGLDKSTAALYAPLQSTSWYGASMILTSELRGGNAKNPTDDQFGSGYYTDEAAWNFTPSQTVYVWSYAYFVIASADNVLNALPNISDGTEAERNNIKAEALFMRALSHFDLVRTYAQPYTYQPNSLGVPVVLVAEIGKPSRNTVSEVYDQILADLLEAESLMADDYSRSGVNNSLATCNKNTIRALLSRVYLYMGNYQKCADYATKVINSGAYRLWTADEYASQWTLTASNKGQEVIFEVDGSRKNAYFGNWLTIQWMTNPDGYGDVMATADLLNIYEDGDVRGTMFEGVTGVDGHYWTTKYVGYDGSGRQEANIPLIRLSEMYLNRAEALYNGAVISGASADSDLKAITSNRGASTVTASASTIALERRKEFAFEGHIVFDLARTKTSLTREDYDGPEAYRNIPFPSYRWAMPIPKTETDANENMQQNEGY